jgi:hypothetical protein
LKTKEFLNTLSTTLDIPVEDLMEYEYLDNANRATWAHPLVAINVSEWISPQFSVTVGVQLFDILSTRDAELKHEKCVNELLKTQCNKLRDEIMKLNIIHNRSIKRKQYPKFEQGTCFYITRNPEINEVKYKIGISDNINRRLSSYRTNSPETQLEYLIYLDEVSVLEDVMLKLFETKTEPYGHEILRNVTLEMLISNVKNICTIREYTYAEVSGKDLDQYNGTVTDSQTR